VLILNWKDILHPKAGGAEIITHEMAKRLVNQNLKVTILTARFKGSEFKEEIDGIEIIRVGKNMFSHYIAAWLYYLKNLRNKYDVIVEEVNSGPYLINLIKGKEKVILYYNQLCREVWFYQFPMILSHIGFIVEPIYTWIQSRFKSKVLTISQSSKDDLVKFGFDPKLISIFSMGIDNQPLSKISDSLTKENKFTILFHGSLRPMKRPTEVLKAFKEVIDQGVDAQLWISGGGDQERLTNYLKQQNLLDNVTFFGRASLSQKLELMQKAHVLCSTSLKEGWGLIVTEANSMATPAISYDVDGLRDSTGMDNWAVVDPNPQALASKLIELNEIIFNNPNQYNQIRQGSLDSAKKINFKTGFETFYQAIKN
jgi:glycosyltransferase involved in cell wall biosynthesis